MNDKTESAVYVYSSSVPYVPIETYKMRIGEGGNWTHIYAWRVKSALHYWTHVRLTFCSLTSIEQLISTSPYRSLCLLSNSVRFPYVFTVVLNSRLLYSIKARQNFWQSLQVPIGLYYVCCILATFRRFGKERARTSIKGIQVNTIPSNHQSSASWATSP